MRKILTGLMAAMMTMTMLAGCDDWCGDGGDTGQAEVSLYVSDAKTGAAIARPIFYWQPGVPLSATCGDQDANQNCLSQIVFLPQGQQSVLVTAEGYQDQTVAVDATSSDSVHLAVEMIAK